MARDPVRRASVVSTGTVRIRPDHVRAGWRPVMLWLLTSRRWTDPLPINVYVLEHDQGIVLFDAGQDRASVVDPGYFPRGVIGWLYRRLAEFDIAADETLPELLHRAGFDPTAVTHVVLSHLHQDHIGGIAEFPGAEVVVSAAEWRAKDRAGAVLEGYLTAHIERPGIRWRLVDLDDTADPWAALPSAGADLLGDGVITLLPTPGHTPGSLSMLIRRPGHRPVVLVGDLTYDAHRFDEQHIPGIGRRAQLRASTRFIRGLRTRLPDLVIAAAHDPAAATAFANAMSEEDVDATR